MHGVLPQKPAARTRRRWRGHALRLLLAAQCVCAVVLAARTAGWLQGLELAVHDTLLRRIAPGITSDRVGLVLATEADVARFGWPLPDGILALAIERLNAASAALVAVDIYRDRSLPPGTEALAHLLHRQDSLLWVFKLPDVATPGGVEPPAMLVGSPRAVLADVLADADGSARRALLAAADPRDGVNHRTLGTAIAERLAGARLRPAGAGLGFGQGRIALVESGRGPYAAIDAAGYQTMLDFAPGPAAFPRLGLAALLDEPPPGWIAGRAVIIGSGAASVRDNIAAPVERRQLMDGAVLHAHVADQLLRIAALQSPGLHAPPAWAAMTGVWLASLAGALAALAPPLLALLLVAGILGAVLVGSAAVFAAGVMLPVAPLALALGLSAALGVWLMLAHGRAETRHLTQAFAHYLDPRIIRDLADTKPELSGERRDITVLFTDLTGFTPLVASLPPARMAALMNAYFEGVVRAVTDAGGLLAEFTGDGVLALFGAPVEQPDHADRALDAARAIDQFTQGFARSIQTDGVALGDTRIGIASGPALVGNLGSRARLRYGALGEPLTVAARLERLNRETSTRIAVSESTALRTTRHVLRPLGSFALAGRATPEAVWTPAPS